MPKFRKRSVVVEAVQFHAKVLPWPEGVCCSDNRMYCAHLSGRPHVHTLEGPLAVSVGDWIITGIAGEHYPCKPDIFKATYEEVKP